MTDANGEELTTVWVGNLQGDITSEGLFEEFQPYGCVLNATVSPKTAPSGARSGFVRFATRGEATVTVNAAAWGRVTVEGLPVLCEWAKSNARGGYSGAYVEHGSSPYGGAYGGGPYGGGAYGGGGYGGGPYGDYGGGPVRAGRGWHNFQAQAEFQAQADLQGQAIEEYAELEQMEQATTKYGGARRRKGDRGRSRRGGAPPPMPPMSYGEEYGGEDELTTLWIGNLAEGTTDADIVGVFGQLGQVLVATVHNRPSPMGSYNGFVRMATRLEAEHALSWCSAGSITIKGSTVVGKWAKMNSKVDMGSLDYLTYQMVTPAEPAVEPKAGGYKGAHEAPSSAGGVKTLWLGSIPVDATAEDVRQAFMNVGLEGAVSLNQSRPSPRGLSGFIRFGDMETAQMAYNMLTESSGEIGGSKLAFDWAKQDTFSG